MFACHLVYIYSSRAQNWFQYFDFAAAATTHNWNMVPINMTVYENETAIISLGFKVFGLVMYLINCFGIFSIFGIIHYEKYGQDSQKRSFSDQIFTFNCIMFMIICPIFGGLTQIRWVFGPSGYTMASFRAQLFTSLMADLC